MEGGQGKLVVRKVILAAAAITLWTATAQAQPGTATGAVTVNGRQFELRYAYASVQPGSFDARTEDVRVLLTDVPVDEPSQADTTALVRLARTGRLHGIEVVLDAKGEPMSGSLFLDSFNGMASVSGVHRFEPKALERSLISGRMFSDSPRTVRRRHVAVRRHVLRVDQAAADRGRDCRGAEKPAGAGGGRARQGRPHKLRCVRHHAD